MTYKIIPKFLYDREILKHVERLVKFGAKDYHSLSDSDKDHITTLIIKVLGADAETLFFGGDNYDKLLDHFSRFLSSADSMDAYDTLCQMRKNAADRYEYELDLLFDEVVDAMRSAA